MLVLHARGSQLLFRGDALTWPGIRNSEVQKIIAPANPVFVVDAPADHGFGVDAPADPAFVVDAPADPAFVLAHPHADS